MYIYVYIYIHLGIHIYIYMWYVYLIDAQPMLWLRTSACVHCPWMPWRRGKAFDRRWCHPTRKTKRLIMHMSTTLKWGKTIELQLWHILDVSTKFLFANVFEAPMTGSFLTYLYALSVGRPSCWICPNPWRCTIWLGTWVALWLLEVWKYNET